jgi:hypothetical protein
VSGSGVALGENRIRLPNYGTPSLAILYPCHSGHLRILGLTRSSSLMCFAKNSTVYIVHATLGAVRTCVSAIRTKNHLDLDVLSAAYWMKKSLVLLSWIVSYTPYLVSLSCISPSSCTSIGTLFSLLVFNCGASSS